jgi:hypothetical protein
MKRQTLFRLAAVVALIAAAALTLYSTVASSAITSGSARMQPAGSSISTRPDLSDYALRHPHAVIAVPAPDLGDWYLRHRDQLKPQPAPDVSDYFLRHLDQFHPGAAPDMSDWYLRHRDQFPSNPTAAP